MARDDATILHVDLDAFFASVEQLLDPALRGRPVVVGGLGPRGVVSAASYEARRFGVHSAMPMGRARRACPDGVFLPPRFDEYHRCSRAVMAILGEVTPLVEQLSIDEAFLDVAGARRLHGDGRAVAALLRRRIRDETGLVASVGVATTKFLAKIASDMAKPDGLLVVEPGTELAFLHPLPASRLWGVGPATLTRLERLGIRTIGDVAALDESVLTAALGRAAGRHLHALAHNVDQRDVETSRPVKSIGAEETFPRDLTARADLERELTRLADRVCARTRRAGLTARTITLKARYGDFETLTRARTLAAPTDVSTDVARVARALLDEVVPERGVRLLGVSLSHLAESGPEQGVLPLGGAADETEQERAASHRRAAVERAADDVRSRFGDAALRPAVLVTDDQHDGEERER